MGSHLFFATVDAVIRDRSKLWTEIIPAAEKAAGDALDKIKTTLEGASDWLKKNWDKPEAWAGLATQAGTAASDALAALKKKFDESETGKWINTNIVTPIGTALAPLVETFKTKATEAWDGFKSAIGDVQSWATDNIFTPINNAVSPFIQNFKTYATNAWDGFKTAISDPGKWATDNIVTPIATSMGTIVEGFKATATSAWDGFQQGLGDVESWANENIFTPINNAISPIIENFKEYASQAWEGFTSKISDVGTWINDNILTPFKTGLEWLVTSAQTTGQGFVKALTTGMDTIGSGFKTYVLDPIKGGLEWFVNSATTTGKSAWDGLTNAWSGVESWFTSNFTNPVAGIWNDFVTSAGKAGQDAWNALSKWINDIGKNLGDALNSTGQFLSGQGGKGEGLTPPQTDEQMSNWQKDMNKSLAQQRQKNLQNAQTNDASRMQTPTSSIDNLSNSMLHLSSSTDQAYASGIQFVSGTQQQKGAGDNLFDTLGNLFSGQSKTAQATDEATDAGAKQLTQQEIQERQAAALAAAMEEDTRKNMEYAASFAPMTEGMMVTNQQSKTLADIVKASVDSFNKQEDAVRKAAAAIGVDLNTAVTGALPLLQSLIDKGEQVAAGLKTLTTGFGKLEKGDNGLTKGIKGPNKEAERENRFAIDQLPEILTEASKDMDNPTEEIQKKMEKIRKANDYSPEEWKSKFGQMENILNNPDLAGRQLNYALAFNLGEIQDNLKQTFDGIQYISAPVVEGFAQIGPKVAAALKSGGMEEAKSVISKWGDDLAIKTGQSREEISGQLQGIITAVKLSGGDVNTFSTLIVKYLQNLGVPKPEIDAMVASIQGISPALGGVPTPAEQAATAITTVGTAADGVVTKFEKATEAVNSFTQTMSDAQKIQFESDPTVKAFRDLGGKMGSGSQGEGGGGKGGGGGGKGTVTPAGGSGGGKGEGAKDPNAIVITVDDTLVAPAMEKIKVLVQGVIAQIVVEAQAITEGIAAAFTNAADAIVEPAEAIRTEFNGVVANIITDAQGIGPGVAAAFSDARNKSKSSIIGLGGDFAEFVVAKIRTDVKGLGAAIVSEFESARSGVISKFNAMGTAAQSTFGQILEYVKSVTTELKSVPSDIPVTYHVSVVGDPIPRAAASGFSGVVSGTHTITVGEAGAEFVSVIPLDKPGSRTPISGGNRSFAAQGFQGIVGAGNNTNNQTDTNTTSNNTNTTSTGIPGTQANVQDVRVVGIGLQNITGGTMPVFISGSAISLGSGTVTGGTGAGGGGGSSSSGGGGVGGVGTGGTGTTTGGTGTQTSGKKSYWVTENGQQYWWENDNGVIRTNMPPQMLSRYGLASPSQGAEGSLGPVGGSGGTGTGTGSGGTGTTDWSGIQTSGGDKWTTSPQGALSVVPMTDASHKGQFKIVDSTGKNVAANFTSEAQANQYLSEKYSGGTPSTTTGGGTGTGTGGTPSTTTGGTPTGNTGGTPTGNTGGTPTTTGGETGTGTGGIEPGGGWEGSPVPSGVQTTGTGSKWQGEAGTPDQWQVVPMTDASHKGQWKVVNKNNGRNIATGFKSEDEANTWLATYHQTGGTGTGKQQ